MAIKQNEIEPGFLDDVGRFEGLSGLRYIGREPVASGG